MSRKEAMRRLQAADPGLKIVSGRRSPYVLKPDEAQALGRPDLPGRTPPPEILELEGQYSLKQLMIMCEENRLSPEGDKEKLVRRLLKKGVLQIEACQGLLIQTKNIEKKRVKFLHGEEDSPYRAGEVAGMTLDTIPGSLENLHLTFGPRDVTINPWLIRNNLCDLYWIDINGNFAGSLTEAERKEFERGIRDWLISAVRKGPTRKIFPALRGRNA